LASAFGAGFDSVFASVLGVGLPVTAAGDDADGAVAGLFWFSRVVGAVWLCTADGFAGVSAGFAPFCC